MKKNDEELRHAYRSYVMEKTPESRGECPTPETLLEAFSPKASPELKDGLIDHLSRCSSCAREFELIRESLTQAEALSESFNRIYGKKPGRSSGSPRFRPFFRQVWAYALASMILISAGAGFLLIRNARARLEGRGAARSGSQLVRPVGLVDGSAPLIFKWEPAEGIKYYVVEISNESLLPVWRSPRVFAPSLSLPPAVQTGLVEGRRYYWSVQAFDKSGYRSDSERRTFILEPPED
jgi:hypothetical protein